MPGILYLVQPAALVGTRRFKVGMSAKNDGKRLAGYGVDKANEEYATSGARIIFQAESSRPRDVESRIKARFREKFALVGGTETFEGSRKEMQLEFTRIVNAAMLEHEPDFERKCEDKKCGRCELCDVRSLAEIGTRFPKFYRGDRVAKLVEDSLVFVAGDVFPRLETRAGMGHLADVLPKDKTLSLEKATSDYAKSLPHICIENIEEHYGWIRQSTLGDEFEHLSAEELVDGIFSATHLANADYFARVIGESVYLPACSLVFRIKDNQLIPDIPKIVTNISWEHVQKIISRISII